MKKIQKVEIDWVDSTFEKSGWAFCNDVAQDLRKDGQEEFKSIGYLVEKTKNYILFCQSIHSNKDKKLTKGTEFFQIPTGCIKKIKYFK